MNWIGGYTDSGGTTESRGVKEVLVLVFSMREMTCFSQRTH